LIAKNHKLVTGKNSEIGSIPQQMGGNDSGHLFNAGVESVSYGPKGKPSPDGSTDQNVFVDDIVFCSKVLALTAFDICTKRCI
jgi:hypothetical protein